MKKEKTTLRKSYRRVYEKCLLKAQKIFSNKKEISKKIKKARKIFEKLNDIPRFTTLSKHICNFCDLLCDYLEGTFTNSPTATIVAIIAGLLYLILPFDVLADFLPIIGWLDDAATLAFIFTKEQTAVNEYLEWKKTQSSNDK